MSLPSYHSQVEISQPKHVLELCSENACEEKPPVVPSSYGDNKSFILSKVIQSDTDQFTCADCGFVILYKNSCVNHIKAIKFWDIIDHFELSPNNFEKKRLQNVAMEENPLSYLVVEELIDQPEIQEQEDFDFDFEQEDSENVEKVDFGQGANYMMRMVSSNYHPDQNLPNLHHLCLQVQLPSTIFNFY